MIIKLTENVGMRRVGRNFVGFFSSNWFVGSQEVVDDCSDTKRWSLEAQIAYINFS